MRGYASLAAEGVTGGRRLGVRPLLVVGKWRRGGWRRKSGSNIGRRQGRRRRSAMVVSGCWKRDGEVLGIPEFRRHCCKHGWYVVKGKGENSGGKGGEYMRDDMPAPKRLCSECVCKRAEDGCSKKETTQERDSFLVESEICLFFSRSERITKKKDDKKTKQKSSKKKKKGRGTARANRGSRAMI